MNKQKPLPFTKAPGGEPPYQPQLWNTRNNKMYSHNCYTYMLNDLYTKARKYGKPQPGFFINYMNKKRRNASSNALMRLSCGELQRSVNVDNPHIKILSLKKGRTYVCPPNYYKGIMIVSPGNDYHFARQDNRLIDVYRAMHRDKVTIPDDKDLLIQLFLVYAHKHIPDIVDLARTTFPRLMQSEDAKQNLKGIYKCSRTWSHKRGSSYATDKDADGNLILNPEKASWDYSKNGSLNYSIRCCYFSIPTNYTSNTRSSGVPHNFNNKVVRDNPNNVRQNLSTNISIDSRYEKLIKLACA